MIVGDGSHVTVVDIERPFTPFLHYGISCYDKGVYQSLACQMAVTAYGVGKQVSHAVVGWRIGHSQIVVHECGHYVVMSGAVLISLWHSPRPVHYHWHPYLPA